MSKVYKAKCIISRGRKNEIQPGTLFVPTAEQEREFLALNAIEEASEQEAALYEKMNDPLDHDGDGKKGGSKKGAASTRARGAAKAATDDAEGVADQEPEAPAADDAPEGDIVG